MYKFSYTFRVQTSDISICAINTCEHQETFRTKRYVVCNGKGFLKQALFAQGVDNAIYCWFSHDVTKFQTSELLILLRFYFHDVLEQLKTNIQTNFHSKWVLSLVIDYA